MGGRKLNMTDYEKTRAEFKFEVPEYFNFASDVLDKWAEDPDKLAILWVDDYENEVKKTFLDVKKDSSKLANALRKQGTQKGDCIMVMLPRLIEWWDINMACHRLGAVISPATTMLTPKDIDFRSNLARATCIITDMANAPKVDQVRDKCTTVKTYIVVDGEREGWLSYHNIVDVESEDFEVVKTQNTDASILYFTSGTTGYPKMTLHSQATYPLGHYITGKFWMDLKPTDLHWNLSDTGWAKAAWSLLYGPWNMGATLFVHHSPKFDTVKTLELLAKYPITTMCGAPTNFRMLVQEDLSKYKFPTLEHCFAAGEPLNPEVIDYWQEHTGIIIRDGYGQTESICLCGNFLCNEVRFGSMGKPSPGVDLQVVDDEGNILPPGREGDLAVRVKPERPKFLFVEYWEDEEKTASVHRGDWYLTGDRAMVDEDGFYWFVGRSDDVILAAGYRIGPFEVESALLEHPAVAESAVVSSPDDLRGEVVKAFVVLSKGYSPSDELVKELQDHVKNTTAPYKYPRKIEFTELLPKTISGKIRRIELREKEWASIRKK